MARYRKHQIPVLDTVQEGAISFILKPTGALVAPERYRKSHPHYWFNN
jgi:beta-lactamase superfamily II metal-dependent hydrolase